jgi:hypothetical protein
MLLQNSVISGDVNINQNNAEDIVAAMVSALERMGFSGQSSPDELTAEQTKEVEEVLEISEKLSEHGIEIDPWTEITLGSAAELAGKKYFALMKGGEDTGQVFASRQPRGAALKAATRGATDIRLHERGTKRVHVFEGWIDMVDKPANGPAWLPDKVKKANVKKVRIEEHQPTLILQDLAERRQDLAERDELAYEAVKQGDFSEIERLLQERETIMNNLELSIAEHNFVWIHRALRSKLSALDARDKGDDIEQSKCVKISLAIYKGLGEREEVAKLLLDLGNIAIKLGDQEESHRFYTEAADTMREIGVPVSQQLLDDGY